MLKTEKLSDLKLNVHLQLFLNIQFDWIIIVGKITFIFVERELLTMKFLSVFQFQEKSRTFFQRTQKCYIEIA